MTITSHLTILITDAQTRGASIHAVQGSLPEYSQLCVQEQREYRRVLHLTRTLHDAIRRHCKPLEGMVQTTTSNLLRETAFIWPDTMTEKDCLMALLEQIATNKELDAADGVTNA